MTAKIFSIFLASFLMLGLVSVTSGKTRTYENERGDYAHTRTEFVNGKRSPVLLRIRKVYPATSPSDLVQRQQSSDDLFLPGYMIVKDQPFEGRLSGAKYSYEYVKGGIAMAGRIYYLQATDGFIYRIQFSGPRNRMWELREQMEFIARSFRSQTRNAEDHHDRIALEPSYQLSPPAEPL